jgi:auxin responsive GH3 family protein
MSLTYRHPYGGGAVVDWPHWRSKNDEVGVEHLDRDKKILAYLEKVTSQPELEQKLHLEYILKKNGNTEYLQKHGMNGSTDVNTFRKCVPVVEYEAFRDSIERITNGDKSPILSTDPATEVLVR